MNVQDSRRKAAQRRQAILWSALKKLGGKEADRDLLEDGGDHSVSVLIDASVDGQPVEETRFGRLKIGHEHATQSATAPNMPQLVGLLLGKLSGPTREKLLDELPGQFLKAGELPDPGEELTKSAKKLLQQLRSKKTGTAKGQVVFAEQTAAEFAAS